MFNLPNLPRVDKKIKEILISYMKVESFTNTVGECDVNDFFNKVVGEMSYFKSNPNLFGQYDMDDELLNRKVNYAFYKGNSDTFVLMHHSDVVNIENFSKFKEFALDSALLEEAYLLDDSFISEDAKKDLYSGEYLFGRGVADMKGGGSIQLALLEHYSNCKIKPSIILIAVPDEENESLGMRTAVDLLLCFKKKYKLNYKLMINSEPHQRLNDNQGIISQGSIGKLNVFVHVKGVLAHGGKALEGINPNGLLSYIISKVDLNNDFINETDEEMTIPPTWVLMRDNKKCCDISFPSMSYGILNVLSFTDTPLMVLSKLQKLCNEAVDDYLDHVNKKRNQFSKKTSREWIDFPKQKYVYTFEEFLCEINKTRSEFKNYPLDIEKALESTSDGKPMIVIGILPPYYPAVTNKEQKKLINLVNDFTLYNYKQEYKNRMYFTGISDLSYSQLPNIKIFDEVNNILGWNDVYSIPFESISKIEMPCVNIGPWGKDFHKPSERVLKEDLFYRTPQIINHIILNYKENIMFKNVIVRKPSKSLSNGITSNPQYGHPNYENAMIQHELYISALKSCGVNVKVLNAFEEYPDSCFVEDVAVCTRKFAMVTSPGAETRKGEEKEIEEVLRGYYDNIEHIKSPGTLEGGDVMMIGDHYYIGLSDRTNSIGANQLIDALEKYGMEGSIIEMKEMLHLKTGLAYLEENVLLVAGEFIEHPAFSNYKKIVIPEDESYAANCIRVNDFVIVPAGYPKTQAAIEEAGLKVITVDTSEYKKVDGGLSCLSLRF